MYGLISDQLEALRASKITPVAIDSCYECVSVDDRISSRPVNSKYHLVILYDDQSNLRNLLSMLFNKDVEDVRGNNVYLISSLSGQAGSRHINGEELLSILPSFAYLNSKEVFLVNYPDVPFMQNISFLCLTPSQLSDCGEQVVLESAGVFALFSSPVPITSETKMFAQIMRKCFNRLRILVLIDSYESLELPKIIWNWSRLLATPESPIFHISDMNGSGRDKILEDVKSAPLRGILRNVVLLGREAKQIRCHAAIVSYMKSQLPVFNRESKQAELAVNIAQLIPSIASKFSIPINDFNSFHIDPQTFAKLDFSKVKKIRDLTQLSQVIDQDVPKLLSVIPHTPADLLELDYSGSFRNTDVTKSILTRSPNIAIFTDDFNSFNPIDGTIGGDDPVKYHLMFLAGPGVTSKTLHRIWRIADKDMDGRLSLPEYAICRDLIEYAKQGGEVPKNLL